MCVCLCALYMLQNACKSEAKSAEPHWLVLQSRPWPTQKVKHVFFKVDVGMMCRAWCDPGSCP